MWALTTKTWIALGLAAATVAAFVGVAVTAYKVGYEKGTAEVKAEWEAEKSRIAAAHAEEIAKAMQRERMLIETNQRLKQEYHNEISRITTKHRRIADGVRNRPETRAGTRGVPEGATAGVGCTGAGLARADAEFLIGYAADAAKVQAALEQCIAQYNKVMESFNARN